VADSWIECWEPRPQAAFRLFCFPYAGVGATVYRPWALALPDTIELRAVQPPGRGRRLAESPCTRLSDLARAAAHAILPDADRPFAIFGHSLGALVGFEVARELRRLSGLAPAHLFASGRRAPQLPDAEPPLHPLPDREFIAEVGRRYAGIPEAVLREPDLLRLLLPTLRTDIQSLETYIFTPDEPLACPLSVFGGEQDERARPEQLDAWRHLTRGRFSRQMFPGGHFFPVQDSQPLLLGAMARELAVSRTLAEARA